MDEGLEHGHERLPVVPKDLQDVLTGEAEAPFNPTSLHGVDQHPGQSERHGFGELGPSHGDLGKEEKRQGVREKGRDKLKL